MTHDCLARTGQMCPRCTLRLQHLLRNLPELYLRLEVEVARATPPPSERSASKEPPLPVSAANLDLLTLNVEQVKGVEAIEGWCRVVIEERSVTWPYPLDSVYGRLSSACNFLVIHLEWISSQPWCDEFAAEIVLLERALRHAVEPERGRYTRTRVCCVTEGCTGRFTVDALDPARPVIVCRTCEAYWEPEAWRSVLAEQIGVPIEIADVAALTTINPKTIATWLNRGQIPNHGKPGAPRVLLSDCLNAWKARVA